MFVLANTEGRIHDARESSISPMDRGFLYGDAVYEVWRTYGGVVFGMDAHWERLKNSARAIGFTALPLTPKTFIERARETVAAYRAQTKWAGDFYVRLQISRGGGEIGLDPALADTPHWVLLVKALPDMTPAQLHAGYTMACAVQTRRNALNTISPAFKTGNYLNNILGLREALAKGAHDVVLLNLNGDVTESSVRNLWFVKGDTAYTPPMSAGILGGITRGMLLTHFADNPVLKLREKTIPYETLPEYEAAFVTSTTQDIVPIASLDGRAMPTGDDSPALRLKAYVRPKFIEACAALTQYKIG